MAATALTMRVPISAGAEDADWPLVQRVQQHDAAAFEELYARYRGPITRMVANIVRYPDQVPDLVQEIFAKAYFALPRFTPGLPFRPWLYRLASNHCVDFLRKRRRQPLAADPPVGASNQTLEWELPDPAGGDVLADLVTHDLADKLLRMLRPRDRGLLVMQDLQGMSLEEIASITGLGLSAVKVGLFRARKRLMASYRKLTAAGGRQ
ncbi:MAG TPA: sigma-70 family RNA polymerase sigma factor [Terriglobales bacterium]|jgi:RNA polymerase sigma-70 factor (ECF subfamily)|nr:sigma-70 family RNA polymerase sigma factor [Terriglobales bacterium]